MNDSNVSGGTVTDVIGFDNGTITGGVTSTSGPGASGGATARAFDAGPSYIAVGSSPFDWNSGAFSIGGWVYLVDNSVTQGGNRVSLFSDDRVGDASTNFMRVVNDTAAGAGAIGILSSISGGKKSAPTGSVPNNAWTHFAFTSNGSGTTVLYVNGSSVSTSAGVGGGAGFTAATIGALDQTPSGMIAGRMYGLVVYNIALTSGQVSALFGAK